MTANRVLSRLATPSDDEFLRELFFEVRAPEFAPANLTEPQLRLLLSQQYTAMRTHYDKVFADAVYWILELDDASVGYEVVRETDEIHLIDIAIRPRFQNQGIGTLRMELLLERAQKAGLSIILSVEVFNPAKRLYDRLGFQEYDEFGMYKRMRWTGCPANV